MTGRGRWPQLCAIAGPTGKRRAVQFARAPSRGAAGALDEPGGLPVAVYEVHHLDAIARPLRVSR